jgi:hypothetical protein
LKEEWIKRHRYRSRDEARLSIFRYTETFYNARRATPHSAGSAPTSTRSVARKDKKKKALIQ